VLTDAGFQFLGEWTHDPESLIRLDANGPMTFGEGSMIEISCVSSRAQPSRVSGTSAMSAGVVPRCPHQTKASTPPFRPQPLHLKQEGPHDSVRASPSDFRLHPCSRQAAQAAGTR
jgi:hypothetical protein